MTQKVGIALLALLLFGGTLAFSQDAPQNEATPAQPALQRGSIPEELLRPRRDEAPRYPIDTVIGPLGQGQATEEAYETARKTAAALLSGNMNAPILASVNKVFLESCMSMLDTITPRYFRLGSGREEPDGAFSFLVRFAGRDEGITGELYVRLEERRRTPPVEATPPKEAAGDTATEGEAGSTPAEGETESETTPEPVAVAVIPPTVTNTAPAAATEEPSESTSEETDSAEEAGEETAVAQAPPEEPPIRVWVFEDLILEEARSREAENEESRHQFDFPPYERFF